VKQHQKIIKIAPKGDNGSSLPVAAHGENSLEGCESSSPVEHIGLSP